MKVVKIVSLKSITNIIDVVSNQDMLMILTKPNKPVFWRWEKTTTTERNGHQQGELSTSRKAQAGLEPLASSELQP